MWREPGAPKAPGVSIKSPDTPGRESDWRIAWFNGLSIAADHHCERPGNKNLLRVGNELLRR